MDSGVGGHLGISSHFCYCYADTHAATQAATCNRRGDPLTSLCLLLPARASANPPTWPRPPADLRGLDVGVGTVYLRAPQTGWRQHTETKTKTQGRVGNVKQPETAKAGEAMLRSASQRNILMEESRRPTVVPSTGDAEHERPISRAARRAGYRPI